MNQPDANAQSQDVARFFSHFSADWDSLYGGKRNRLWRAFDAFFRRDIAQRYELTFAALGKDLTGKTVLDIGCGSGIYTAEAARRGAKKVVGIDIAPGMIDLAREYTKQQGVGDRCELVVSNFPPNGSVPALDQKFDSAIVMGVMDYVEDPVGFLRALKAQINGFAVLTFPYTHIWRYPVRKYRYKMLGRPEVYHYSVDQVRGFCEQAGFSGIDMKFLTHSGGCHFVKLTP